MLTSIAPMPSPRYRLSVARRQIFKASPCRPRQVGEAGLRPCSSSEGTVDALLAQKLIVAPDCLNPLWRKRFGMQHSHLKLTRLLSKEDWRFFDWFCHVLCLLPVQVYNSPKRKWHYSIIFYDCKSIAVNREMRKWRISVFHPCVLGFGDNHDNFQEQHYPAGAP